MIKTATIVYLICFSCYVLFTRQPDYFNGEFARGTIVCLEKDKKKKSVRYRVGSEAFVVPLKGWGARQVAEGDAVEVIHDPSPPSNGSMILFLLTGLNYLNF